MGFSLRKKKKRKLEIWLPSIPCNFFQLLLLTNLSLIVMVPQLRLLKARTSLIEIPSPIEIREAVFGLKKHGLPGPDGFYGVCFTSCWDIVGKKVIQIVTHFFSSRRLLRATNAFFITLLPKTQSLSPSLIFSLLASETLPTK